jgi:hypothetical protein
MVRSPPTDGAALVATMIAICNEFEACSPGPSCAIAPCDFKVKIAPRRPGDPAQIIAASERARATLGWKPQYDNLATNIGHALA